MNAKGLRGAALGGCVAVVCGVAMPAAADVSFTPRVGIYFDNTDQRESGFVKAAPLESQTIFTQFKPTLDLLGIKYVVDAPDQVKRSTPSAIPQYGGTLTFDWRGDAATQIALTGLYGKATTDGGTLVYQQFATFNVPALPLSPQPLRFTDTFVFASKYRETAKRLDVEATIQHRLNETFSFIAGLRVERRQADFDSLAQVTYSYNVWNYLVDYLARFNASIGQPPTVGPIYSAGQPPLPIEQSIEFMTYSARVGAAAYSPVGEKHLFYVNGLLQVSRTRASDYRTRYGTAAAVEEPSDFSDTSIGPDISVGYMYRLSDRFGFDVRYRATIYFPVAGDFEFKDSRVNHGLGLGFTAWFGR